LLENVRHQQDRLLGILVWHGVENLFDGGLKVPASRVVATVEGTTLGDLDGSLNSVFLGLFYASCGPSFSGR
jgi:hypothetical protein